MYTFINSSTSEQGFSVKSMKNWFDDFRSVLAYLFLGFATFFGLLVIIVLILDIPYSSPLYNIQCLFTLGVPALGTYLILWFWRNREQRISKPSSVVAKPKRNSHSEREGGESNGVSSETRNLVTYRSRGNKVTNAVELESGVYRLAYRVAKDQSIDVALIYSDNPEIDAETILRVANGVGSLSFRVKQSGKYAFEIGLWHDDKDTRWELEISTL